jgi:hypothetical protein
MLDENFRPGPTRLRSTSVIEARGEAGPVAIVSQTR